ncbi:MAG TPA: gliding motility-associated C-terminal domain-containing protein [Cytophagaceae bacterium]|nr:gliding motility-associated C-terminal domain-containing protein [Cytophagaceae bacterium]
MKVSKGVQASPNESVTSSCNKSMVISGGAAPSITWRSITDASGNPANGVYNSGLSCTSGCDSTTFTAPAFGAPNYPSVGYVDFEVSKVIAATACTPGYTFKDTVRMAVIQKTVVTISPPTQSICFENTTTTITANASFGTPPYTYLWSNGATTQSIAVPAGNYTVNVSDANTNASCLPSTSASIKVAKNTGPNTANIGGASRICTGSTVPLNGSITSYDANGNPVVNSSSGGTWSGGTGSYNPNANTPNAIYTPSAAERSAGTVSLTLTTTNNGNCPAGSGVKTITIDPLPIISAGPNQNLCKNNAVATLSGSASNTSSVLWTSPTGGAFSNASSLNTTYTPTATDLSNGSVILTLTGNAAVCSAATSTLTLTFTNPPTIDVGPASMTFCIDNPHVPLTATITGPAGVGVQWSGGIGSYNPNSTSPSITYNVSPTEILFGGAGIYATTTNNGNCKPVKDSIFLTPVTLPTVNAGVDKSVCRNNPTVSVTGTVTGSTSGTPSWTSVTSGSAGFSSPNSLTTNYTLNATDLANGGATLVLSASPVDPSCTPKRDTMLVSITASPTVSAGPNQSGLCYNPGQVSLNGFSSTGSGTWSGGAGTFSPSATTANATYNSTAGERGGTVTLTYTSAGNVNCNAVAASMTVTFAPPITVSAGPDIAVCLNKAVAIITAATSSTSAGIWSGGTGTFTPGTNTLNPTYTPSAAEISAGTPVTLTLTSAGTSCPNVNDAMQVTFTAIPTITTTGGAICADNPTASINTTLTVASGVVWSGGAGTFSPNNTSANFTYTPTLSEIGAGSVTLTGTTTGNGTCNAITGTATVTIAPIPVVDAGPNQVLCGSTASVSLNGTVTGATGGQWTTTGTGTFGNAASAVTTYTPSAADKASGLVTLTLTSTGNGLCNAVNKSMTLTFTVVPTINAGPNQTVCTNDFPVQLNGTGSPATWVGGAGIFNPGRTTMNATYTPDASEVSAGTVTLTLTTNTSGACPQVSSTVTVTISQPPIASPGAPFTVCGDVTTINLSGSVNSPIATGGIWSTTGTGTIASPSSLITTYSPSATDKSHGSVTFTLTTTGSSNCSPTNADLIVTISPAVTVFAGPDQTLCNNVPSVAQPLAGAIITGATNGTWSIFSGGSGTITNATSASGATYTPNVADATVTFRLTTTNNPVGCPPLSDDVVYTFKAIPTVNAGPVQTVCGDVASVTLAGSIGGSATTAHWTTTGGGTFSPNNTTLNAQYIPATNETGSFNFVLTTDVNGPCAAVSSTMALTITPKPTANAGVNQTVCANKPAVTISGTVTQATGGNWTTAGDGSFSGISGNGLTATYTPGPTDISNGSVSLKLTTTGMGTCNPVSDAMLITITPAPVPNAGPDRSVCANNPKVNLIGSVTVTSTGTWSTLGTGSFSSVSADGLTAVYTPSGGDISAGTVTLRLTSANNGLCNPVFDDVIITITGAPTVNAGPDQTICADSFFVKLNALHTVSIAGIWTSSSGGPFFATPVLDTAMYVPTAADKAAGTVTLTYTTTSQGSCNPVSDNLVLTITAAPTVNAGPDQTICSTTSSVSISATKTVSSGIKWTTTGSGTFGSSTGLATTYTPSAIDISAGSVILTSTTTGSGTCRNISDQLTLKIIPQPAINLGPDITVCADLIGSGFALTPTLTNVSNTVWSTGGSGIFSINTTTNNVTYIPSSADTTAGSVLLSNVASGLSPCGTASDSKLITFRKVPRVNAGPDQTICNGSNINLSGAVANASGGTWTSAGSGSFSPDANTLSAIYIPSPVDTTAGNVVLTLTTTGIGTCTPVSDNLLINFQKRPLVNAGADQTVCIDEDTIKLVGFTTNAPGGNWTGTGNGTYVPDNLMPITNYLVTGSDRTKGQLVFTLTTINTAPCAAVSDNVTVTFRPLPVINIGPNLTVCAGTASVNLGVTLTNATGGLWSTAGDGTFSNASLTNPVYTFGVNDNLNGSVALTYTATNGIGLCSPVSASMIVSFVATLVSDAGPPSKTVCTTDLPVTLSGSGAAGVWSTSGDGTFSNANQLSSIYTPGPTDLGNATVTLTLTPVGLCPGTPDNIVLNFIPGPTINAGPSRDICTDVTTITMNGFASDPAVSWTSSGSGGFNNNSGTAIYTLSSSDISSGSLVITYRIPANGFCNAIQDTMTVTIHPIPSVSAGPDKTRCANLLSTIKLNGSHSIAPGVQWTKLTNPGLGTLSNSTSDIASYTPDASDVAFGKILFELEIPPVSKGFCTATYSDTMALIITPAPNLTIGPDSSICADKQVPLTATFTVATGGIWTTSGSGTFSPSSTLPGATYIPSSADTTAHTVTLTFTTTGNGICAAGSKSRTLTMVPKPSVSAGADFAICSGNTNTNLFGSFNNAGGIRWQTTGTGTFAPDPFTLAAIYTPSQLDKDNGGVTLSLKTTGVTQCDTVVDYVVLQIVPSPVATVYAGANQIICRDESHAQLDGVIQVATAARWDCQGAPCSGTFQPSDSDLEAKYLPSAADTAAGTVILRLTTTAGNGICAPNYDEMQLTILDVPKVNAGIPQTVCADTSGITLNGSVQTPFPPPGYSWVSSGTGIFAPNAFVNNPTYIPSATDKTTGSIGFTLTSTNNGTCQAYSSTVISTITAMPTVNAGPDKTTCANVTGINLLGSETVASHSVWTSSTGGTFSGVSANGLSAVYALSALDTTVGVVTLKLTTNAGLGSCKPVSDQITFTINHAPIANAGPDKSICADGAISIAGKVTNATGGIWSSLGTGKFSSATNQLTNTYTPSAADTSAGSVDLILTTTGSALLCLPEDDTIAITIDPRPVVVPGSASICRIVNGATLNGVVVNATGGKWTTSGTGVFSPDAFALNAMYYPSMTDYNTGQVTLTLTSQGNGLCNPISANTTLSISPTPVADAGVDQFVCNGTTVTLAAAINPINQVYQWKDISGTVLAANATSIQVPITTNTFIVLTVYDNKNCPSDNDTVLVRSYNMPSSISLSGTSCFSDSNSVVATVVDGIPAPPFPFYQWLKDGAIINGENNLQILPSSTGTYIFIYSFGDCQAPSAPFTINPSPSLGGIDKTNCVNNSTTLSTSNPTGGSSFTYAWNPDPTIIGPTNTSQITVQSNLSFDTIPYRVTATNEFNCSTSDSVYLISVAKPLLTLENDTLCQNQVITLVAQPTNYGVGLIPPVESYFPTYVWTKDGVNLNNNSKTQLVTSPGKYIVEITIGDCNNNTDSSVVLYNNFAIIDLPDQTKFCAETDSVATLDPKVTAPAGFTYTYLWTPTSDTVQMIKVSQEGLYHFTVTSTIGTNSCPVTDSILVRNLCPPRLFVPNAFTPDGTANKNFRIFGAHYTNFRITIFSRWGEVLFSSDDLEFMNTVGWDGTYRGAPMPLGVYPYVISYDGEEKEFAGPYRKDGDVLILR